MVGDTVRLSPLYDTVPVLLWPAYSQRLAMRIGTGNLPIELTARNWQRFATESELDADMVVGEAFAVMASVADQYREVFADGGADQSRLSIIAKHVKKIRKAMVA